MARWKLVEPHYLMVPENFWEQTETDRDTGKQKRKKYPVPTHLDPKDPGVWTHKSDGQHITQGGNAYTDGEIIVRWEVGYTCEANDGTVLIATTPPSPNRAELEWKDLIFVGPPTPGMLAIDDEAKEIMTHFEWKDPFKDKYFGMTYAERLVFDSVTKPSGESESLKAMGEVLAQLAALTAQNTALLQKLSEGRRL